MWSSRLIFVWVPLRFAILFLYSLAYVKRLKTWWNKHGCLCKVYLWIFMHLQYKLRVLTHLICILVSLFYLKGHNNLYFYKLSVTKGISLFLKKGGLQWKLFPIDYSVLGRRGLILPMTMDHVFKKLCKKFIVSSIMLWNKCLLINVI